MPERRRSPRLKKRLPVVFDDGKQTRVGFSINFSIGGMSIGATHALPPGTPIKGKFTTRDGQDVHFEAAVQWSRQIQGMPGVSAQNTMGLALRKIAPDAYESFWRELSRGRPAEEPLPPEAASPAERAVKLPPVGIESRLAVFVGGDDLAAPSDRFRSGVALAKAALWIEQVSVRALAAHLSDAMTAGVSLDLSLLHDPPVGVGAKIEAAAKLTQASDAGQLIFDVTLSEGGRELARGKHVRRLLEPRAK